MNNHQQDLIGWFESSIAQMDQKLKELRTKADPSKRKVSPDYQPKGSKTENFRRSADQIEEHRKMFLRMVKLAQKDPTYLGDHVTSNMTQSNLYYELKEATSKYLQSPGSLSISKSLHDIYKTLNLEGFKEIDESLTINKSEHGGPAESENESITGPVKDWIIKTDNRSFEFEAIAINKMEQRSFMDMFRSSYFNRPNESVGMYN